MLKTISRYGIVFLSFAVLGVVAMDYIILPSYVGYDNEHYLPDVRGKYIQKAKYTLQKLGFTTEVITIPFSKENTPSTVVQMSPRSFTKVKEGRTITLTVAGHREDVIVPDFTNQSLRNAKLNATREGLVIDTVIYEFNDQINDGNISFQVPRAGHVVKSSAYLTLGVSKGAPPDYYNVPDIIGKSLSNAKEHIIKSGLRIGKIEYEYQPDLLENTVIDQSFTPGLRVTFPAAIDIIVSTEKEFK